MKKCKVLASIIFTVVLCFSLCSAAFADSNTAENISNNIQEQASIKVMGKICPHCHKGTMHISYSYGNWQYTGNSKVEGNTLVKKYEREVTKTHYCTNCGYEYNFHSTEYENRYFPID